MTPAIWVSMVAPYFYTIAEVSLLKPVKIGLCGLGTVGSGTINLLQRNINDINARAGTEIIIEQVGARRDNPNCDISMYNISRDVTAVVSNPELDVVVELIGGTGLARELVMTAIANGKHVVTANKALIAEFGGEIFAAAKANNVTVAYEAAVAGGIPIVKAMREGLAANSVEWLAGIINGTGNFILTEMRDKGRDFADVLKEAQELGYAEADPTFDVEGIDAAHKLVILASLAFAIPLPYDKVFCEGISTIEPEDVSYAEQLGYRIKHLGIGRRREEGIELRVHPTLIPEKRLIANVDGVMNSVLVQGDGVGPTLYYGAGAGAEPTASSVIADIVDIARGLGQGVAPLVPMLSYQEDYLTEKHILPIEDVETGFYLRISAADQSGVMSEITQILTEAGASIEALIQKEPKSDQNFVDVALITNQVKESLMNAAISKIESLDRVNGRISRIRVEQLS